MFKTLLAGVAVALLAAGAAHAGPRADCAALGPVMPCLDAKLKEANQKLNGTLKAAQERLEQMQAQGRRPVMGAFVDSQRKFNAFRDAQCSWQGVRAGPGENSAEYVRECQLIATVAREEDLAAFVHMETPEPTPAPAQSQAPAQPQPQQPAQEPPPEVVVIPATPATQLPAVPGVAEPMPQPVPLKNNEWRLLTWVVGGTQKSLLQDSVITIAFDPSGKVAGNASINRFSGTYSFDNEGRLRWPPSGFAVTRMAGPPALMAQERAFLESLRRTSLYKVDGQQLVLENTNSTVVLAFTR